MKIANALTKAGYLRAVRGRSGGLVLAKPPHEIKVGDVIHSMGPDFVLVECFAFGSECSITRCCQLRSRLHEGLDASDAILDKYALVDMMFRPKDFGVRPDGCCGTVTSYLAATANAVSIRSVATRIAAMAVQSQSSPLSSFEKQARRLISSSVSSG
ncbi:MAG: Rrf2 family transcriptional regulator [Afipia sp.]|nr:Rrf2 family transcriptional regulator [Afipia sp.]